MINCWHTIHPHLPIFLICISMGLFYLANAIPLKRLENLTGHLEARLDRLAQYIITAEKILQDDANISKTQIKNVEEVISYLQSVGIKRQTFYNEQLESLRSEIKEVHTLLGFDFTDIQRMNSAAEEIANDGNLESRKPV